jgi:amino acid permease
MFQTWAGDIDSVYLQREFIMGLTILVAILPLSIPRRIHFLRYASFVALSCMLYVFILVIVWAGISNFDDMVAGNKNRQIDISGGKDLHLANFSQDVFFALPIVAFAFSSHIQVYKIYREMGVSDVPGMMNVVHLSVGACSLLYLGVGIFGYLCFYQVTSPNLLNNFTDESNGAIALAKIGLAIVLVASAPLFMLPMRDTLNNLLFSEEKAKQFSWIRHIIFTVGILGFAYLLACVTPEVSDVLSLTGSLCSTAVMYLFPATFYLALEQNHTSLQDKPARNRAFGAKCVLVWGTVMCIAGTTVSIYEFATKDS